LFASPDPVTVDELAAILSIPASTVQSLLLELEKEYADPERGFFLERVGGGVRLCSKPQYAPYVEALGQTTRPGQLSQAALETLAIIAYRQPITRPEIEAIRGVRAESAIASLIDRGLIEEKGRSDGPGRPILYGTTQEFLIRFGLDSLASLPPLPAPEAEDQDPQSKLALIDP
jgi:segregation and condensation protein B